MVIDHETVADAGISLRNIRLVAKAGADDLPIFRGILGPPLSRDMGLPVIVPNVHRFAA